MRNKEVKLRETSQNSWVFYQSKTFLKYKGIKEWVKLITVNSAYTSQTYYCCWQMGARTEKKFKRINQQCGWIKDADLNCSLMIALLGLSVNNLETQIYWLVR